MEEKNWDSFTKSLTHPKIKDEQKQLSFVGYVDDITDISVHGWVCDREKLDHSLEIEIYADEVRIGETIASIYRPDLQDIGLGNGKHGFNFSLPANAQEQQITVKVKNYDYEVPKSGSLVEQEASINALVASLKKSPKGTLPHVIHHYIPNGIPNTEYFLEPTVPNNQDDEIHICKRLIASFNSALNFENNHIPLESRPSAGLWEVLRQGFQGEMYDLLQKGDPLALSQHLCNGYRESLCHGLAGGKVVYDALSSSKQTRLTLSIMYLDRFIALSEALGVLPYENPEQNKGYGVNIYENPSTVAEKIEDKLGISVGRPRVFGFHGLQFGDRVIEERTADHLWASWRIQQIAGTNKNICEIGGGFGGNCHYSYQMGCQSYTIIDLPIINVVQGYFLMKCFGEEVILLFGESISDKPIKVMPYWHFLREDNQFDICFNQDSLPEMPFERALEYLNRIPEVTRSHFYSINQEACAPAGQGLTQLNIPEIMAKNSKYNLLFRYPNWIRKGYVEELYSLTP